MKKTLLTLMLAGLAMFTWSQTVVNFNIAQPSLLEASAGNDVTITDIENTTLTASATGGTPAYTYKWSPATDLSSSAIASPIANPKDTTAYTVTVTDKNKCTASAEVTVNVTKYESSIDDNKNSGLSIYPNPVGTNFYINLKTQSDITEVMLFTLDGKELWRKTIATAELPVTNFEAPATKGMYLLKVISENINITETIVVK
jgi:hypothetical protein